MANLMQSFVGNLALVALFISGWAHARDWAFKSTVRVRRVIFGAFLGAGAVASMLMAVQLQPGLLFDLRSSLLVVSALFGGPVSALVTTVMAMSYRILVGGAGVPAAIVGMALVTGAGLLFFYLSPGNEPKWKQVLLAAGAQALATVAAFAALPTDVIATALSTVMPPVVLLGLLATVLSSFALMETRRRSQERDLLVAALAQSPDFTYVKNSSSQFAAVNEAVAKHHGFARPAELVGKTDADLEEPARAALLLDQERRVLNGGVIRDATEYIEDHTGAGRWFATSKVPLRNADGRILGLAGVTRDITADKQFQQDLIEAKRAAETAAFQSRISSELLATTLEAMDQGLILVRPDDTMPLCNRRAAELLDVPWSFLQSGPTHGELVAFQTARGDFRGLADDVMAVIANPVANPSNFEAKQPHGIVVETRSTRTSDGGIVRTFTDISLRKQTEQQLELALSAADEAKDRAEAASLAKTEFLSTMSHEIRTPLNAIIGFTHLALDEPGVPPTVTRKLELIRGASEMLLTVVNDVLDFSRIEAGEIPMDALPLSIRDIVQDITATLMASAQTKGLGLSYRVDDRVPNWLMGDHARLRQILLNLINNAIKFTAAGGVTVLVDVVSGHSSDRPGLRFAVKDTGIGIAPEKLGSLFKRFAQVDSSITRRFGGSGLGLAITKQLAELMNGRVGVESVLGEGSEFWFEVALPVTDAPADVKARVVTATVAPARILLADDLALNAEIAATILQRAGHDVHVVSDGEQAVAAVGAGHFDMVLMDVQMPGMDGLTATRHIRSLSAPICSIPIIAMTANVLPQQLEVFAAAGMDDHLGKPFRPDEILQVVAKWVIHTDHHQAAVPASPEEATFAELKGLMGIDRLSGFLQNLLNGIAELETLQGDTKAMGARAHMLVSQSGMLGFLDISQLAKRLERACDGGTDVREIIRDISMRQASVAQRLLELTRSPAEPSGAHNAPDSVEISA